MINKMKKKRNLFMGLICAVVLSNVAVTYASTRQIGLYNSKDYVGNIKGYVNSFITDTTLGRHRGSSYVAVTGSDFKASTTVYEATSSLKELKDLNKDRTYAECKKTGYFSHVMTTLETDKSKDDFFVCILG